MAAAEFNLNVNTRVDKAIKNLDRFERKVERLGKSTDKFRRQIKGALVFTISTATVAKFVEYSDILIDLRNRLSLVTDSTQELQQATDDIFEISKKTRVSFEATGTIYSRVALAARELGVSQKELKDFTTGVNQAIILSGTNGKEAAAGMIQFSQGIASGSLRGDELRSVLEQLPFVADVIAKELKITRGEMREFGKTGKITAEVVLDAFRNNKEFLEKEFAKTIPSISQAFAVLNTSVLETVRAFNEGTGASAAFARAIIELSYALDTLIRLTVTYATAVAGVKLGSFVKSLVLARKSAAELFATKKKNIAQNAKERVGTLLSATALRNQIQIQIQELEVRKQVDLATKSTIGQKGRIAQIDKSIAALRAADVIQLNAQQKQQHKLNRALKLQNSTLVKLGATYPRSTKALIAFGSAAKAVGGTMAWFTLIIKSFIIAVGAITIALVAFSDKMRLLNDDAEQTGATVRDALQGALSNFAEGVADYLGEPFAEPVKKVQELITLLGQSDWGALFIQIGKAIDFFLLKPVTTVVATIAAFVFKIGDFLKSIGLGFKQFFNDIINYFKEKANEIIDKIPETGRKFLGIEKFEIKETPFTEEELDFLANGPDRKSLGEVVKEIWSTEGPAEEIARLNVELAVAEDAMKALVSQEERLARELATAKTFFDPIIGKIKEETRLLQFGTRERKIQNELSKIKIKALEKEEDVETEAFKLYLKKTEAALREKQFAEDRAKILDDIRGPEIEHAAMKDALQSLLNDKLINEIEYKEYLLELEEKRLKKEEDKKKLVSAQLQEEIDLVNKLGLERELYQNRIAAREQFEPGTDPQVIADELALVDARTRQLYATQNLNAAINAKRQSVMDLQNELVALEFAYNNNNISMDEFNRKTATAQANLLKLEGTTRGNFIAVLKEAEANAINLGTAMGELLVESINNASEAFSSFLQTGRFEFRQFVLDIVNQMIRILVQATIMIPILKVLQALMASMGLTIPAASLGSLIGAGVPAATGGTTAAPAPVTSDVSLGHQLTVPNNMATRDINVTISQDIKSEGKSSDGSYDQELVEAISRETEKAVRSSVVKIIQEERKVGGALRGPIRV